MKVNNETSIILVIYKQKQNLGLLYKSLYNQTYKNFTVYFVDNNSDDDDYNYSIESNKNYNLNIVYLKSGYNSGFAGGNNIGAKAAINDRCKYIFFLNNDAELDENCLMELVSSLKHQNELGAASPVILYGTKENNDDIIQELGAKVNFKSYKIIKNYEGKKYGEHKSLLPKIMYADLISGGASLIKAEVLNKTGLWEEKYFAYGDEIDLAKRIQESGYKTVGVSSAILWHNHKWEKENKRAYYFEYYLIERNKYLYFHKYKLYFNLFISLVTDLIKFPWRLIWFKRVCDFSLGFFYLRGLFAGVMNRTGKPEIFF